MDNDGFIHLVKNIISIGNCQVKRNISRRISMRSIKLAQWCSTIAILVTTTFLLITGTIIIFGDTDATMGDLVTLGGIIAIFIGPEKLAAFFGPYLKGKQENGTKDTKIFNYLTVSAFIDNGG
jgi:hypothetical protein